VRFAENLEETFEKKTSVKTPVKTPMRTPQKKVEQPILVNCDLSLYTGFGSTIKIQRYSDKSFVIGNSIIGSDNQQVNASMCMLIAIYDNLDKKYLRDQFAIYSPWSMFNYLNNLGCQFSIEPMQEREQLVSITSLLCITTRVHLGNHVELIRSSESNLLIDLQLVNNHYSNSGD
jgi:hypothetical protein